MSHSSNILISWFIVSIYVRVCVCVCPYRLHKFNLVPIILEMEVTVKDPVSLFFVHCPFICWFSLAHSVSFTEVPNLTRKEWQKAENQKNVKSTNLSPWRSPRRTHGGQVTNRGVIAKKITTTPPKKIDIWEPVAEVKRSPPMGLRSLVLAPFLISSFLAENCRMRSLNTDSQFWLIWGYPHLRKRPCATKTSDVSIESHRIHAARFGRPKDGREATLIFDLHIRPAL